MLVANRRAQEGTAETISAQAQEYEAILMEHGTDYAAVRGGYRGFEGLKPYGDEATFAVNTPGEETLTLEEFLGQTQSLSVAPMPGHAKYAGMQQALRAFFARWSVEDLLRLETMLSVVGWRTPRASA